MKRLTNSPFHAIYLANLPFCAFYLSASTSSNMNTSDTAEVPRLGCSVKQVDEKHASTEIREMVWSPKMDLVAAITAAEPSELILYRLHALKKVWTHPPPTDDAKITSVAWDPLGKCRLVIPCFVEYPKMLFRRLIDYPIIFEVNEHEQLEWILIKYLQL